METRWNTIYSVMTESRTRIFRVLSFSAMFVVPLIVIIYIILQKNILYHHI